MSLKVPAIAILVISFLSQGNLSARKNNRGPSPIRAIGFLANRDLNHLASLVHPKKGLRFSPYELVDDKSVVLTRRQLRTALNNKKIYNWGQYDGSGEKIELTFSDYYDQFVYNVDFLNAPGLDFNSTNGVGNLTNNMRQFYPNGNWIEYHFPAQYQKNDWYSLWLVFENYNNKWYLVAIVHGRWTI